jgi:hypothetical protein
VTAAAVAGTVPRRLTGTVAVLARTGSAFEEARVSACAQLRPVAVSGATPVMGE